MAIKFAIITDPHFGEEVPFKGIIRKLSRHTVTLVKSFVMKMNNEVRPDFVAMLGDVIEGKNDATLYAKGIALLRSVTCPLRVVIGDHDQDHVPRDVLVEATGSPKLYYSFDCRNYHFIVLFSEFDITDIAHIDAEQQTWLKSDLAATHKKTVVFVHRSLSEQNVSKNFWFNGSPGVWSKREVLIRERARVREILTDSGKVIGVFQGHTHQNALNVHSGIPYITVQSPVENWQENDAPAETWALVTIDDTEMHVEIHGNDTVTYPAFPIHTSQEKTSL